jgi:hypothetical protein
MLGLAAGIVLLALSLGWPSIVGGRAAWTDDQANSLSKSGADLHLLSGQAGHALANLSPAERTKSPAANDPASSSEELANKLLLADERARRVSSGKGSSSQEATANKKLALQLIDAAERYRKQRTAFDEARTQGQGLATILRWSGIALLVGGIAGSLAARNSN